jgi:hypothetical protein
LVRKFFTNGRPFIDPVKFFKKGYGSKTRTCPFEPKAIPGIGGIKAPIGGQAKPVAEKGYPY